MTRKILATLLVAAAMTAPLRAELKYTLKLEAHKSTVPPKGEPDPLMAMISAMVANTVLPPAPVELAIWVGPSGVRAEYLQTYLVMPAGTITLVRPDGSMVVMNPVDKTFWKSPKSGIGSLLPGLTPQVTTRKTGTTATVAGMQAEEVTMDLRLPLPPAMAASMPPGFPMEFVITGEMWLTGQYKDYAKLAATSLIGLSSLGVDKVLGDGLLVRSILRGAILGDQEFETVITKIGEEDAPAGLFDIPDGYKEVPPPSGIGGMVNGVGAGRE